MKEVYLQKYKKFLSQESLNAFDYTPSDCKKGIPLWLMEPKESDIDRLKEVMAQLAPRDNNLTNQLSAKIYKRHKNKPDAGRNISEKRDNSSKVPSPDNPLSPRPLPNVPQQSKTSYIRYYIAFGVVAGLPLLVLVIRFMRQKKLLKGKKAPR